jgi:uncharacterized protein (DUF2249 family)
MLAKRPTIHPQMTVEQVLQLHPAMIDAFVSAGFRPLVNPILRRLFAGVTTLEGAARKKGWDGRRLAAFVADLNAALAAAPVEALGTVAPMPELDVAGAPAERHPWGLAIDNRGLEPPQPMLRILGLLDTLAPGERLEAHNDREPVMLLPRLHELGHRYDAAMQPDGSCRVTIWK